MSDEQSEPEPLVQIRVTNAIRTSAGPGPGVLWLPASEANRIQDAKLGKIGSEWPRGYLDGGNPAAVVAASKVFGGHNPRPGQSAGASN